MTQESTPNNAYINTNGSLKKKVLFVITQSELGGAQKFLSNLVSHLDRDVYEFLVAVGSSGNGDFLRVLKSEGIPFQTLKFLKREPASGSDIRAVFEIRKLIKNYRPDVLFLNSSKAGFIGSLAAVFPTRINALKVVYRIGGWSFNDPWPKWKKWFWIILEWLSAKWKDVIIVNNLHDLEQAKKLKIKPRRETILIHNGVEVYKLDLMQKEEARTKLFERAVKLSEKNITAKNIVGTIANFYPTKGLEYLIGAADYLNGDDAVFFIIGDGELRPEIEKMIISRGLENKVFLLGQIPDAYRFLPAFDVFVLPSVKEGFPWAVIEAMSAKLPVIATDVGAMPEIIDDHKNGLLVKPRDSMELAHKIKEVLENDRLRNELGIQAHQTVLFKFELDKMVQQIENLL